MGKTQTAKVGKHQTEEFWTIIQAAGRLSFLNRKILISTLKQYTGWAGETIEEAKSKEKKKQKVITIDSK